MNKKLLSLISVFFLSLLLFKGIISIVPAFSSNLTNLFAKELAAESETEQKKGSARVVEASVTEELFDHITIYTVSVLIEKGSSKRLVDIDINLPNVCLDIPTPPPNRKS